MEMVFFNQFCFYMFMGVWMLFLYRLFFFFCILGFVWLWNKKEYFMYLNNSKFKCEVINDVKIVVNLVC